MFSTETADRTQRLGWFLLVANLVGGVLSSIGGGLILQTSVRGETWHGQLDSPDVSFTLVVVALGVLTFARMLRWAVALQDEVDATI